MKTITELKVQVKNKKRVSVYLDGAYFCGLDLQVALLNRLKVGAQIDEKTLVKIQMESEKQTAFDKALKFIERSVKTERAVRQKLATYGYLNEVIDVVIEKLKGYSFLSDKNYAERYVSTYSKNKGKRLIRAELKQKGVSDADMESALMVVESELESAVNLAKKYAKNKPSDQKNYSKCYKYLLSKGFTYEDSLTATKQAFNTEEIELNLI
ncbi:MAG: regulatory protein RecX [Clostridia bacterium]|nr:regulatory protein RecX [Clostridia bacterium]